jgi:diguanylate cyclase (GGDEF)-like protein
VGPLRRDFPLGGAPPAFFVVDEDGVVLLDLAGRSVGDTIPAAELASSRPIRVDGVEVGRAVATERPMLTDVEQEYLAAIEDAWVYAVLLAAALAVPVGLFLGTRFTGPIEDLTGAIRSMRAGALRQSVPVRSHDEVGQLSFASRARLGEQAELLKELSRRDDLTTLFNRRAFDEQVSILMAQAHRYGRPLTLALADIDHFKQVNDRYSHATGDAVLREVAGLIEEHVREADLVARYGGEEFVIAFPETDLDAAVMLTERLRELVAVHDWERIAPELAVTISVGLSTENGKQRSFREVLAVADARLYDAKAAGRNKVGF